MRLMVDPLTGFFLWIFEGIILPIIDRIRQWFNDNIVPIWKLISDKFMGFLNWVINLAGSVIDYIAGAISSALNWVSTKLLAFVTWLGGIVGTIANYIAGAISSALNWVSTKLLSFVTWIGGIVGSVADYIGGAIGAALSWVTSNLRNFTTWLGEIGGSLVNYIGGAISSFVSWTSDQLGSIWKGIETLVGGWIEGLTKSFFQGLNIGIQESGHSPLDTEKETDNQIMKGLHNYMIKYRNERDKKTVK